MFLCSSSPDRKPSCCIPYKFWILFHILYGNQILQSSHYCFMVSVCPLSYSLSCLQRLWMAAEEEEALFIVVIGELWSGPLLHTPRFYLLSPSLIRISNQRCVDGKVVVACALQYIFCSLNWLGYLLGLLRACSHITVAQKGISVPPHGS